LISQAEKAPSARATFRVGSRSVILTAALADLIERLANNPIA
jgi:hypothetical protein